jgi:hypothetical protein
VQLGAAKVRIFDGKTQVATHERVITRSGHPLILDTTWRCCCANPAEIGYTEGLTTNPRPDQCGQGNRSAV